VARNPPGSARPSSARALDSRIVRPSPDRGHHAVPAPDRWGSGILGWPSAGAAVGSVKCRFAAAACAAPGHHERKGTKRILPRASAARGAIHGALCVLRPAQEYL